jgi:demethylmenaquinone methyltransferase/2-methoxy-6-polyprenyl-1,4-benzoquinol methylase
MANPFYAPGPPRAQKVADLFATIAPRYDLINDLQSFGLHRRWKRRLVGMAGVRPGERALDVCCGTGDLAFALARRGAQAVGLDFSPAMLAVAESRAKSERSRQEAPQIASGLPQFVPGDAQALPFADGSFDIVTVGYGLRNLANWETGLREMQRVARPGGRLLVLDFGKPANALWRGVYFGYLKVCVPLLGLALCGNAGAYAYILESLQHYPAQTGIETAMRAMGLCRVQTVNLLGGVMSIHSGEKAP